MAKRAILTDQHVQSTQFVASPRRGSLARPVALALMTLAMSFWWLFPFQAQQAQSGTILPSDEFSWSKISPAASLQYHDCFDGLQCARLDVPMDYNRSDGHGLRVAIAIARIPAKVPVTDPRYGGAVLINPGGPGGSGVAQALISGRDMQVVVDADADPLVDTTVSNKYFDIIGFDPRGVNNTTPGIGCFPNLFSQRNWELQSEAEGMLGSSSDSLSRNWQRTIALNTGCSASLSTAPEKGQEALGEHVNTPPVARDMLEIIERHAEWREKQGQAEQLRHDRTHGHDSDQSLAMRTKWNRGEEKLHYWGRSYGTVLGMTFATMYPDRIGRAVLDGVVNLAKYYADDGPNPIIDADAIFDRFALYCDTAGEGACPFYAQRGASGIKESYHSLEKMLYNASLPVPASETRGPEVVTWTDLKLILRIALYQPLVGFPLLAQHASNLAQGDGSSMADFKHFRRSPSCPSTECLVGGPWSPACQVPGTNEEYANTAIICSDADYLQELDEDRLKGTWQSLREDSFSIGDYWAHIGLGCVGWNVKAKWRIPGPYTSNTSHPLLFISNTLDPVTPLQSAQKMSSNFPGSVLLEQDSEGHSTLSAPSLCVNKNIRRYFQTGELPPQGTLCNGDMKPFSGLTGVQNTERTEIRRLPL